MRVIDLSMGWAGPMVPYVLACLGAEVIKVEDTRHFDWWRGAHPRDAARGPNGEVIASHEMSHVFNSVNRGKRGITLDLSRPEGVDVLLHLVAVSDVLVENFTPRVMRQLGIGYDALSAVNPSLIMLSMPAFGGSGPEAQHVGFGMTIEAMSGLTALCGYEDGPPQMMTNAFGDPFSGLNGVVAVLMAWHGRRRTGRGTHIELSQLESFLPLTAGALLDAQLNRRTPLRSGNRHPSMAPHRVYPCKPLPPAPSPKGEGETLGDEARHTGANQAPNAAHARADTEPASGPRPSPLREGSGERWIAVAVGTDQEWQALCEAMGKPDLAADPSYADVISRRRHEGEIDALIAEWMATQEGDEALARLLRAGVPAAAVRSNGDVPLEEAHLVRGFFELVERAHVGPHLYPGLPFLIDGERPAAGLPAPCLGEHNDEVLVDLLGLSGARVEALRGDAVIGDVPRE